MVLFFLIIYYIIYRNKFCSKGRLPPMQFVEEIISICDNLGPDHAEYAFVEGIVVRLVSQSQSCHKANPPQYCMRRGKSEVACTGNKPLCYAASRTGIVVWKRALVPCRLGWTAVYLRFLGINNLFVTVSRTRF